MMMNGKKLLILGGSKYIVPLIEKAHEFNVFVITCDYLPDNVAHKYSDLYVNESVIDKDAILKIAIKYKIDGISSFACDPGVITAAYVADKLGLPNVGPYESVCILQDKTRFRTFLKDNGFNVPWFFYYTSKQNALLDADKFHYPMIVKPADSAGSKGVSKVDSYNELESAIDYACDKSLYGKIIIEEFLDFVGSPLDTDAFSLNGQLVFSPFSDMLYDDRSPNVFTPVGDKFPSSINNETQTELRKEIQRLFNLLDMKTAVYNIESRLCTDGHVYLMEVAPRGGGNRVSETEAIAYGFDYFKIILFATLGIAIDFDETITLKKYTITYCVHSLVSGIFNEIEIDQSLKAHIYDYDLYVKKGDFVKPFIGANNVLGFIIFTFDNNAECEYYKEHINQLINLRIDGTY